MEIGTIVAVKIDKGYGFIQYGCKDVFFHCSDLADGLPFDETLHERRVEFSVVGTDKGASSNFHVKVVLTRFSA